MRRGVATLALVVGACAGAAPAAFAADHPHHGRDKPWPACPHGHARAAYPPRACKVETNRTSVRPGGRVSIFGLGFRPGERVVISMSPIGRLDTVTANGDGAVLTSATMPADAPVGTHMVVMTGASGNRIVGTIRVVSGQAIATRAASQSLPAGTGTAIPLAAAGAMMLASGAVVMTMVRRRRRLLADG